MPLCCPVHGAPLADAGAAPELQCPQGCSYPVVGGIARFVGGEGYAAGFGLQWRTFRRTQLDSHTGTRISRDRLARIAGGLEVFRGKRVLEVGCGAGRFTEVILSAGALVFAVDISSAVEANYENCGGARNYFVCQADVMRLPVAPQSFDIVLCIGVIQHTPDPEATIAALCAQVKPGGSLFIDHYTIGYAATLPRRMLRALLLRLSPAASMRFCEAMIGALWPIHQIAWHCSRQRSPVGRAARKLRALWLRISPVVDYHDAYADLGAQLLRTWALLDTHDTLTDVYKHLRTREEIERQLALRGMTEVRAWLAGNGVEARASRPA